VSARLRQAAAAVDEARLWNRHVEMARHGARDDGGVNRQALSPEDAAARRLLVSWATEAGFACATDPIGNLFVRREGRELGAAPVLSGSHLDSQPAGGRFDGVYGVLAGLEALQAIDEAELATRRPIEVVAWCNEEGSRFAPGAMGSAAFAGAQPLSTLLDIRDREGTRVEDALAATLAAGPPLRQRPLGFPLAAYVEAHIEQGPVLEAEGRTVGVVTAIQGARWFAVEVHGSAAHAGTTPLRSRRDALRSAVSLVTRLEEAMDDPTDTLRFTVGRFEVSPNSPNTVPERVAFSIDLRHPDPRVLDERARAVAALCRASRQPCEVEVREVLDLPPVQFDETIVELIERSAATLGLPNMRLPSGAFHDAMHLARLCPAGMVFIPCAGGVSHSPRESARSSDLAAGARVLGQVLFELAR
jgi:N-carbamoyl-L-amino-acid hydrolase